MLNADNPFYRQVTLLVELLPLVARESCFALKGGTAINLFVRDLPRLSVDIDLTYLPIKGRDESWRTLTRHSVHSDLSSRPPCLVPRQ